MTFEEATKQANKMAKATKTYYTAAVESSVTGDRTRSWNVTGKYHPRNKLDMLGKASNN